MSIFWSDAEHQYKASVTADAEVLRILYARVLQQSEQRKPRIVAESYYNEESWRDQITIEDAQWLTSLGISPL